MAITVLPVTGLAQEGEAQQKPAEATQQEPSTAQDGENPWLQEKGEVQPSEVLEPPPSLPEVPDPPPPVTGPPPPLGTPGPAVGTVQVLGEGTGAPPSATPYTPRSTLFIDLLTAGFNFGNRIGQWVNIGAEFGGLVGQRLRLSVRALSAMENLEDQGERSSFMSSGGIAGGYTRLKSTDAEFLYGATVGVLAASRKNFSFSPGIALMRSNVADYGTMAAVQFPFEWELRNNFRIGFAVALGRAFGGYYREVCTAGAINDFCSPGQERKGDRTAGTAVYVQFNVGWGIIQPSSPNPNLAGTAVTAAAQ